MAKAKSSISSKASVTLEMSGSGTLPSCRRTRRGLEGSSPGLSLSSGAAMARPTGGERGKIVRVNAWLQNVSCGDAQQASLGPRLSEVEYTSGNWCIRGVKSCRAYFRRPRWFQVRRLLLWAVFPTSSEHAGGALAVSQRDVHLTQYACVVERESTGGTAWLGGNGACPGHVYGSPGACLHLYVLGGGVWWEPGCVFWRGGCLVGGLGRLVVFRCLFRWRGVLVDLPDWRLLKSLPMIDESMEALGRG